MYYFGHSTAAAAAAARELDQQHSYGNSNSNKTAHLVNTESFPSLSVAGMDGEEEELVIPEAGCQGPKHPRGVLLVGEEHHLGMTHAAAKGRVHIAAGDAADNVWKGGHRKAV